MAINPTLDIQEIAEETELLLHSGYNAVGGMVASLEEKIHEMPTFKINGRVTSTVGAIVIANLPQVKISDLCIIFDKKIGLELYAEVIAIDSYKVKLLPFGNIENISHNCQVQVLDNGFSIGVGDWLLGKIVNGFGQVTGSIKADEDTQRADNLATTKLPVVSLAPDPLSRPLISQQLITGISAIDLFVTCGLGQRIGIFAGPGMGKTTLMGMIIRNSVVDVVVVGLIGERGREVREFIELELTGARHVRCVVVVATSDRPPIEQVKCAYVAQTIAEYFRSQGKRVLLFIDSITRFARAQREIGLSAGEPPTRGGFPPSVFLSFPRLMERAGQDQQGSITAFYTVLMEGETVSSDPIADEVKSIIDGHIVLSRKLSESGHFPAIDILASLSRVADRIIDNKHMEAARHIRMLLSKYEELEFLIRVGEYQEGQDPVSDEAIKKHDKILHLLKQARHDNVSFKTALQQLIRLSQ